MLPFPKIQFAVVRTAADEPVPGSTIDPHECSAPFTNTHGLRHLQPILGVAHGESCVCYPPPVLPMPARACLAVRDQLRKSSSALRDAGVAPVPVMLPLATLGDPEPGVPLRAMVFVPDTTGGGWVITEDRFEQVRIGRGREGGRPVVRPTPPPPPVTAPCRPRQHLPQASPRL